MTTTLIVLGALLSLPLLVLYGIYRLVRWMENAPLAPPDDADGRHYDFDDPK